MKKVCITLEVNENYKYGKCDWCPFSNGGECRLEDYNTSASCPVILDEPNK